jgi:hypothetical protein
MAEAGNVTGHAQRVGFSTHVLNGSVSIHEVTIAVMTNSTIAGEADITKNLAVPSYAIPDSDIQFTINSLYSILAGVAANWRSGFINVRRDCVKEPEVLRWGVVPSGVSIAGPATIVSIKPDGTTWLHINEIGEVSLDAIRDRVRYGDAGQVDAENLLEIVDKLIQMMKERACR